MCESFKTSLADAEKNETYSEVTISVVDDEELKNNI